jgi:AraC-like DNA-binding protein
MTNQYQLLSEVHTEAAMGASALYRHLKPVTETTPIQHQKDQRLLEARRLLRELRARGGVGGRLREPEPVQR